MTDVLARADELVAGERWLDAIEVLHLANRTAPDPAVERRLAHVRNVAFDHLEPRSTFDEWPPPVPGGDGDGAARLPEVTPAELDAETVRLPSQKRESEPASTGLHRAPEGRVS
jgi:hypothetical protein